MKRLRRFGAGLIVLSLLVFQPAWANQDLPTPYIHVKRELGDPEVEVPPIGIVGMDDFSQLYITSPLRRFLGETPADLTTTEFRGQILKEIQRGKRHYRVMGVKDEPESSVHYVLKNQVVGYILGGYMPVSFHNGEDFLQKMYALPNDCRDYLQGKTLPDTLHFECYTLEHADYIEAYVIDVSDERSLFLRGLIVDAFYPRALKEYSKRKIERIIDKSIARERAREAPEQMPNAMP